MANVAPWAHRLGNLPNHVKPGVNPFCAVDSSDTGKAFSLKKEQKVKLVGPARRCASITHITPRLAPAVISPVMRGSLWRAHTNEPEATHQMTAAPRCCRLSASFPHRAPG